MKGTIIERNGSYRLKVSLGKNPDTGKYDAYYETFRGSKPEAQKRLRELLTQLDKGTFIKPAKVLFGEFLDRWYQEYVKPNEAPRTTEVYEQIIRLHVKPNLGKIPLTSLRREHFIKYYAQKINDGLAALTVEHHHSLIHKALETAIEWEMILNNPSNKITLPTVQKKEMETWTPEEIEKFLAYVKANNPEYYALFHLDLFSGMRRSEILGLKWADVDFMFGQISVKRSLHQLIDCSYVFKQPKTEKGRRTIALTPSSYLVMQDYYEQQKKLYSDLSLSLTDDCLVFCHIKDGRPLRPNTITRAWSNIVKKAGLKHIRLHDARHSHATILFKKNVHPKIVQERLGHSNIAITLDTYSHVLPGMQQAAAKSFDSAFSSGYNDNHVADTTKQTENAV